MPKKVTSPPSPLAPRFQCKTFALTGYLWPWFTDRAIELITPEGGRLVSDVTATLDFLVVNHSNRDALAAQKKVAELNKSAGAAIRILSGDQFNDLFLPSPDLALGLLRSGPAGIERFNLLRAETKVVLDLGAVNLRDLPLAWAKFEHVNLDGADLRGADLSNTRLPLLASVRLDGANLHEARFTGFRDCNLRNANLTRAYHNGEAQPLERCDFTGANLTEATLSGFTPAETVFRKANLGGVNWNYGRLKGADFRRLNLGKASFARADLTSAQLAGARLEQANLQAADLTGADLTRAELRGAVLVDANLSQATIDGANFAGANLIGANLTGTDLGKARGLDSARTIPAGKVGPNIQEWEKLARGVRWLYTAARIVLPDGLVAEVSVGASGAGSVSTNSKVFAPYSARFDYRVDSQTVSAALVDLPRRWADGSLLLESVTAWGKGAVVRGKALTQLAVKAWCEGCGVPVPSADDLKALEQKLKAGKKELHEQMLADLRGGAEGIKRWNERGKEEREKAGQFRKADLSGANLDGVSFGQSDFSGADFAGASLRKATCWRAKFNEASFKGARCQETSLAGGNFRSATFEGADLTEAKLFHARLGKANFTKADLTGADLSYANLCGADFSTANLTGTVLDRASFDGTTTFPTSFPLPQTLNWKGGGPDPRSPAAPEPAPSTGAPGVLDLDGLLGRLRQHTEPGRVANALQMLKADRFRLFSQVDDNALVGVVKSQSDPDLVYSCRLASDGSFSCCTQNLRPCGGLHGKPCKHLLVLIVGLAKGRQLEPATVEQWVQASGTKKPALDKDAASAVFLRYKGAEAGEIDWRPTETIPEDYYAF